LKYLTSFFPLPSVELKEDRVYPHYMVMDDITKKPIYTSPIYKAKPVLQANETTIVGKVEKGVFKTDEKLLKLKLDTPELMNGEYWLKLKLSEPKSIYPVFVEKPKTTEKEIVLRGKVEKSKFKNDSLGIVNANNLDSGSYWAKLNILKKKLIPSQKDEQPKKAAKQIVLFGQVYEGYFKSYIYECGVDVADGKYWILLDVDTENAYLEKAVNEIPTLNNSQLIVEGSINSEGLFVSEMDVNHQIKTDYKEGKYWFVFDILNGFSDFTALKETVPQLEDNQSLIEGLIWVDKYTGEIKFDPKKNRDDHRHHAIDALVIALSKQSYFQQLSTYNAQREAKRKGLVFDKEQLNFDMPWEDFYKEAKHEAEKLLISHSQNTEVLTVVKKRLIKNGKSFLSVGNAVRGQLHKENVYGKRQDPMQTTAGYHMRKRVSELKDNQLNKIVDFKLNISRH